MNSKDLDQTVHLHSLIWIFAVPFNWRQLCISGEIFSDKVRGSQVTHLYANELMSSFAYLEQDTASGDTMQCLMLQMIAIMKQEGKLLHSCHNTIWWIVIQKLVIFRQLEQKF